MSTKGAGGKTPATAIAQIIERVDALSPETYVPPSGADKVDANIVGQLTDHQRRLWTVYGQLVDEHNSVAREAMGLEAQIKRATNPGFDPIQMLKNLAGGSLSKDVLERFEALRRELKLKDSLSNAVRTLLWADVRFHFPELADKDSLIVFEDWSVGWLERPLGGMIEVVVGGEMPHELASLLRGMR